MKKATDMGNATQLYVYGDGLDKQKKYTEALGVFKWTNEKFPKELFGSYAMAKVYAKMGNQKEAVRPAEKAIQLSTNKQTTSYLQ